MSTHPRKKFTGEMDAIGRGKKDEKRNLLAKQSRGVASKPKSAKELMAMTVPKRKKPLAKQIR